MTKDFYAVWNRMLNNKVEERTEDATAVDWQWCGKPRPVKQKTKKKTRRKEQNFQNGRKEIEEKNKKKTKKKRISHALILDNTATKEKGNIFNAQHILV